MLLSKQRYIDGRKIFLASSVFHNMTVLMAQTWIQVFHCEESWNYKSSLQALCLQCLHRAYTATGIVLAPCVPPPTAHIGKVMEFFNFPLELGTMGAPRSAYMPCIKLGNF